MSNDEAARQGTVDLPTDPTAAARRSAALVAAVVAFVVPPWFIAALALVGTYRDSYTPGLDAPERDFVQFYVDNFSEIPLTSTMFIIGWSLMLVVLIALVRALDPGLTLPGILAITFAGLSTAVSVASQGLFTYPTIMFEMTAERIPANLDPATARFIVLSTEGVQNAGGVVIGVALLMVALLAARSDLWGHWAIAAVAAVMGVAGTLNMVLGGGGSMIVGMIPFGIFVGVVLLIARSRLTDGAPRTF
jgi:hypothetical protein